MNFNIGEKIVCIKPSNWKIAGIIQVDGPTRDEVVTVYDLHPFGHPYLEEYQPINPTNGHTCYYDKQWFRRMTDAEVAMEALVEEAIELIKERQLIEI